MPKTRFKSFIICTSPRSGSTLLCKLLSATEISGYPNSYFHNPSLSSWLKSFNLSNNDFTSSREALRAIFAAARNKGTGKTEIFGLRLQRGSFDFFMEQIGVLYPDIHGDQNRVQAAFGQTLFIHLTRENKLNQAISCVKAQQTGLWHMAADGTELERLSAPKKPFYNAAEIERHIIEFTEYDVAWNAWFSQQSLEPLRITYNELSDSPAEVLANILERLGLDRKTAYGISPPVAKLADGINRNWEKRFRAGLDTTQ